MLKCIAYNSDFKKYKQFFMIGYINTISFCKETGDLKKFL